MSKHATSQAAQITEAFSVNEANQKIREGWTLLAVVTTSHPAVNCILVTFSANPLMILAKKGETRHNVPASLIER